MEASHAFLIKTSCERNKNILLCKYFDIYGYLDLASTKSSYSPIWRVQNLFGEYEIEVTRQFGEYEFFLMSNPVDEITRYVIKSWNHKISKTQQLLITDLDA